MSPLTSYHLTQHRLRDRRSLTCTAGRLWLAAAGGPGRACQRPHVYDLRLYGRAAQNLPGWSGSRGWLAWLARCRAKLPKINLSIIRARDLYSCLTQCNYTGKSISVPADNFPLLNTQFVKDPVLLKIFEIFITSRLDTT